MFKNLKKEKKSGEILHIKVLMKFWHNVQQKLTWRLFDAEETIQNNRHGCQYCQHSLNWYANKWTVACKSLSTSLGVKKVFHSSCTLSGGSHCFQPVHPLCTDQAAAQGDDRWCLSPSTAWWHIPSCLQTPRCHCLVLPGSNPGWWELDVLHKRRQKKKT